MTQSTPDERNALEALPRLACGLICYPGRMIARDYLGSAWEARIVFVGDSTIDVQYMNQGSHAAKGCVSRLKRPSEWMDLEKFRENPGIV